MSMQITMNKGGNHMTINGSYDILGTTAHP